jgi:hypothetical protein
MRKAVNLAVKEQNKSNVETQRRQLEDKVRREAEQVKQEKMQQKDFMHVMKH